VLTEGTDLPRTECILHAKPTSSATLYEQTTGRGLRIHPDDQAGPLRLIALASGARFLKSSCIVIDLVDVARRHSLQAAPVLYGLPPSLVAKGKSLQQLKDEYEEFVAKYPGFDVAAAGRCSLADLRMKASTFDIWQVPELGAFGKGRALDWIKFGPDQYQIQYPWADGTETLTVAPDILGHFEVVCTLRPAGGIAGVRQRTLATQVLTAEAAAGLAEAFVLQERRSVMKLKDRDAPWRSRPASSGQIGLLRRLRVPFKNGITMGEASSLIDLAKARGGRR
jgi:ATP-dependent helicase IRC3